MCECDVYTGLYFVQILHTIHSLYICVHAHLCRSEGIPADDTVLQGIMGRVASTPEGKCLAAFTVVVVIYNVEHTTLSSCKVSLYSVLPPSI